MSSPFLKNNKNLIMAKLFSISYFILWAFLSSCTMKANINSINQNTGGGAVTATPYSLVFNTAAQTVSETAGTAILTVNLTTAATQTVTVNYSVTGGTATGGGTDYTLASGTLTFNPGDTSKNITMTIVDDGIYEGDKTVVVTLSSPTNATIGTPSAQTVTIQDNEAAPSLGAFTITGIAEASGTSVTDAIANNTTPRVVYAASANATSYDVSIYADDDTTVVCAVQNTAATALTMTGCTLSVSTYYRARVVAKLGAATLAASNANYRFFVNALPVLGTNGNGPWYVMQNSSITIQAQWAAAPVVGVATDADGDALSFTNLGAANKGTLTNNTTNIVYTAGATSFGKDTFTVTVVDARGGELATTITIHIMTATTWTGGASNTWSNAATGNWCGAINANKNGCTNAGPVPTTTHTAIIDDTCQGANCTPTTNYAVDVQGLKVAGSTLNQGAGQTLTIGSSGYVQTGGIFNGSNANITVAGTSSISAGTFQSTSATFRMDGNFTYSAPGASFTANSGTVHFYGTVFQSRTLTPGAMTFNHVIIERQFGADLTLTGTLTIAGNLTCKSQFSTPVTGGTINLSGDFTLADNGCAGTTSLRLVGSSQTVTGIDGAYIPNFEIAVGAGNTVNFSGTLMFSRDFLYTSGTVNAGTSTAKFAGSTLNTITPGSISFKNVSYSRDFGANLTVNGTWTITGNLVCDSSAVFVGGTINVSGDITLSNLGCGGSTTYLRMVGTSQTLTGVDGALLPHFEIAAGAGTVNFSGTPTFSQDFTYTSGTVNAGTSTAKFVGGTITSLTPGSISFNNVSFSKNFTANINLTGTWTIAGNLVCDSYAQINGGTVNLSGNLTLSNSGCGGSTTLRMVGSSQTITGIDGAYIPNFEIAAGAGTVNFSGTPTFSQDFTYTSGTVNAGTSTAKFVGTGMTSLVPGSIVFNNVIVSKNFNANLNVTGAWTINGNLTCDTSGVFAIQGTTINLSGNLSLVNAGCNGTSSITMTGGAASTISQSFATTESPGGTLTINKTVSSSSQLTFNFASGTKDISITASGSLNMAGNNLTVSQSVTNLGVLQRGNNPTCGTLSFGSYSGNAAICP